VLQERTFERVGGSRTLKADVRIIAATHRNLEERIAQGTFREDLYYRLNVVPVEMPPLRERAADLPLLIEALGENIHAGRGLPVRMLPETVLALQSYRWPGNVRELGNLLERLAIECAGRPAAVADLPVRYRPAGWVAPEEPEAQLSAVAAADHAAPVLSGTDVLAELERPAVVAQDADAAVLRALAPTSAGGKLLAATELGDGCDLPPGGMDLRDYLENLERRLIVRALEVAGGTVAQAARLLGLRRTTLVEKLRKYELSSAELSATGT